MATWVKPLPQGSAMVFECIGKHAAWRQFGRIKCGGFEGFLNDTINHRVVVPPRSTNSRVYFTPYHDSGSHVGESRFIEQQGSSPNVWIIRCEDSSDGDYNDYVVRVSIVSPNRAEDAELGILFSDVNEPRLT